MQRRARDAANGVGTAAALTHVAAPDFPSDRIGDLLVGAGTQRNAASLHGHDEFADRQGGAVPCRQGGADRSTHAIGVGFPQGVNAAFDATTSQWRVVWRGRFLDAMSNWQSREMPPIKPLGEDVKTLEPESDGAREFAGYRVDKEGVPTFLYRVQGQDGIVEDTLRPTPDGRSFERTIKSNGKTKKEAVSW